MMTVELLKTGNALAEARSSGQQLPTSNKVQQGLAKAQAMPGNMMLNALAGAAADRLLAKSFSTPLGGVTTVHIVRRDRPFPAGNGTHGLYENKKSRRAQDKGILEKPARMRKP